MDQDSYFMHSFQILVPSKNYFRSINQERILSL